MESVCFTGHRNVKITTELVSLLDKMLTNLIEYGADIFISPGAHLTGMFSVNRKFYACVNIFFKSSCTLYFPVHRRNKPLIGTIHRKQSTKKL